jgi:hypothetical protein
VKLITFNLNNGIRFECGSHFQGICLCFLCGFFVVSVGEPDTNANCTVDSEDDRAPVADPYAPFTPRGSFAAYTPRDGYGATGGATYTSLANHELNDAIDINPPSPVSMMLNVD